MILQRINTTIFESSYRARMTSTFILDSIMEFPSTLLVFLTSQMIFFMGPSRQNKLLVYVMYSKLFCQVVIACFMLGSSCLRVFMDK